MNPSSENLLPALLDSWERNNTILVNLLLHIPESGMNVRPIPGSPSVAELFMHVHYVRLAFVMEDAKEVAEPVPEKEWEAEPDRTRMAEMLHRSSHAILNAVKTRLESSRDLDLHYDHPILLLQHMIWHEGYHHGQIKLSLKLAGHPIPDDQAGPLTWNVWMNKAGENT